MSLRDDDLELDPGFGPVSRGQPAPLRHLRQARELPGRRRGGRPAPAARGGAGAAGDLGRPAHLHIPDPRRHALLAAIRPAGRRAGVPQHVRARPLAQGRPGPAGASHARRRGRRARVPRRARATRQRDRRPRRPAHDHPQPARRGPPLPLGDAALLRGPARHSCLPARWPGRSPRPGPYYVRSQTAGQTVLERNPNYRGDRPARPARIVYLTGIPTAEGVALARAGRADVVPWDYDLHGPLAPGGPLDRRYGRTAAGATACRRRRAWT